MTSEVEALRAARDLYDEALKGCPYSKTTGSPPSAERCKVCGADSSEPCRRQVAAAFNAVDAIRTALKSTEGR